MSEKSTFNLAQLFFPELGSMSGRERTYSVADVLGALYTTPLALAGLVWLVGATELTVFVTEWPTLLLLLMLLFLFERLDFFIFVEVTPGIYADWRWSFWTVVTWSAALIFGPTVLWVAFTWRTIAFLRQWLHANAKDWSWNIFRNYTIDLAPMILAGMIALTYYERWGGTFPLPTLTLPHLLPAFYALGLWFLLAALIWTPLLIFFSRSRHFAWAETAWGTFARYLGLTMGWQLVVDPFAILATGLYGEYGIGGYIFFILILILQSLLLHHLSEAIERSQLRSRELERLERLGRAIINMSPDASGLTEILRTHMRNMFPYGHIEIRFFPNQTVLHSPEDWAPVPEKLWAWVRDQQGAQCFLPGSAVPWGDTLDDRGLVVAPILPSDRDRPFGGIYLARYRDAESIHALLPAVQTLSAQIASALSQAHTYRQALELQQVEHELRVAGQIQASFLPRKLPEIPGWELEVTLRPARETSGDFYDVIPLPNGRFGILVADVADKGTGAALYMALSRTLLRTYALQYHTRPDYVQRVANRRILMDTNADLFVTVFYAILEPWSGQLTYCNAGHMPPYLLRSGKGAAFDSLMRNGVPLGIFDGRDWEQVEVQLEENDTLVLYTDGLTDAENVEGEFFGRERLLALLLAHQGETAFALQTTILDAVRDFVGEAPQFDDITLMVLRRLH